MRILLYTGKGGVGKTSIAAATALKISSEGLRTIIMSTDQAHSLSDSFGIKLGNSPEKISENLYGVEINSLIENEKIWGKLKKYIEKLLLLKSEKTIETEELLVFPGFEELLSLIRIKEFCDSNEYDVVIVDCAPTGETLSLLKFPELFKWWMAKLFPMKRKAAKIAKPMVEATFKIPIPSDDVFEEIENIYLKLDELHEILTDKKITSIRIVTTPEKIVINETKRNFSYLHLFDLNVDGIIINKIFSEDGSKGYFENWVSVQEKNIFDLENSFQPINIFKGFLYPNELRGIEMLKEVGSELYGDVNPADILWEGKIFEIYKKDGDDVMKIHIPFIEKNKFDLLQRGDEMSLSVNNERRSFILPKRLHGKEISGAKYDNGYLNVTFI
jgi:arsenite-transporting ATPase